MTLDAERIAERWAEAWSSFRAVVTTWPYGEAHDEIIEGVEISMALETEAERLRELIYLARDAGLDDPDPVTEYRRAARFTAKRARTNAHVFGPVATALLLDWFRDEQRPEERDPFVLADRLREVEDSAPALCLDGAILHHYLTSILHRDLGQGLLSSIRKAGRRPEWRSHFEWEEDVWFRIRQTLESA